MDKKRKRELAAGYQNRTMVGGVCAIVNTVNGKRLLLSATEVARLHNLFDFSMGTGQFSYMELHADAKVFGMAAFRFEVLELLEKEELQSLEQFAEDIAVLCDIWKTKFEPGQLY